MPARRTPEEASDAGFLLVGLVVAIFLILLTLSVAAPRVAKALRRDREQEAIQRGKQYTRAIQLYFRKTGHYPGSLEQLEKTNNVRFLRQRYADPMTGKPDWRLIHLGEAKTTVKGFFGKPLAGMATGNLGSVAGMVSPGGVGAPVGGGTGTDPGGTSASGAAGGALGASGSQGGGPSFGAAGASGSFGAGAGQGSASSPGSAGAGFGSGSSGPGSSSPGFASQAASSFSGTGKPIMGVSSMAAGDSIAVLNEQTTYATWEFLYDPRIEQLKAKTGILGGPANGTGASTFGGSGTGLGSGSSTPGFGGAPGTGSGGGSLPFGAGGSNPTSPSTPAPASPANPPQ